MRWDRDQGPSLWTERGIRDYGMDLTDYEREMERLDEEPGRTRTAFPTPRRAALSSAPGLTDLSPTSDRRPGDLPVNPPGPQLPEGDL